MLLLFCRGYEVESHSAIHYGKGIDLARLCMINNPFFVISYEVESHSAIHYGKGIDLVRLCRINNPFFVIILFFHVVVIARNINIGKFLLIGDTGSTRGILFQVLARNSNWTKVKVERRVDCKVEQSRTQFKVEQNPKIPTASLSASTTPAADKGCNIVKGTKVNNSKMNKGKKGKPAEAKNCQRHNGPKGLVL